MRFEVKLALVLAVFFALMIGLKASLSLLNCPSDFLFFAGVITSFASLSLFTHALIYIIRR